MINHQKMLGTYEKGTATQTVVNLIAKLCDLK
jgi:hypothetical protein